METMREHRSRFTNPESALSLRDCTGRILPSAGPLFMLQTGKGLFCIGDQQLLRDRMMPGALSNRRDHLQFLRNEKF
jgi:hypothetical protein